jgi:hypothetical protein
MVKLVLSLLAYIVLPLILAAVTMGVFWHVEPCGLDGSEYTWLVGVVTFLASFLYNAAIFDLRYQIERLNADVERLKGIIASSGSRPSDAE